MASPKILVVGSSNTDMVIKLDHLPKPGESVPGGEFFTNPGGKGANQAVGAARAGGDVTFIARVGQDMFGGQAIQGFASEGINVDSVIRDPDHPTGVALIFVSEDGENSIGVALGANTKLSPADVLAAKGAFTNASILLMQLETPVETVQAAAELAAQCGVRVILNPAPACPLPPGLLKHVSILTPNETELELLTGMKIDRPADAEMAADCLLQTGVETVVVTLGAKGALVANRSGSKIAPSFRVKPVDTTAAGDTFNGALAVALAEGQALTEAVRFANAAAAISVTRMGARSSAPTRNEIDAFLANNPQ